MHVCVFPSPGSLHRWAWCFVVKLFIGSFLTQFSPHFKFCFLGQESFFFLEWSQVIASRTVGGLWKSYPCLSSLHKTVHSPDYSKLQCLPWFSLIRFEQFCLVGEKKSNAISLSEGFTLHKRSVFCYSALLPMRDSFFECFEAMIVVYQRLSRGPMVVDWITSLISYLQCKAPM